MSRYLKAGGRSGGGAFALACSLPFPFPLPLGISSPEELVPEEPDGDWFLGGGPGGGELAQSWASRSARAFSSLSSASQLMK